MSTIKELSIITKEIAGRQVNKLTIMSDIASVRDRIQALGPIRPDGPSAGIDGSDPTGAVNNERRKARDKLRYLEESLIEVETELIQLEAERYMLVAVLEYGED